MVIIDVGSEAWLFLDLVKPHVKLRFMSLNRVDRELEWKTLVSRHVPGQLPARPQFRIPKKKNQGRTNNSMECLSEHCPRECGAF